MARKWPPTLASAAVAVASIVAAALEQPTNPPGFISIDCGHDSGNYPVGNIIWLDDQDYTGGTIGPLIKTPTDQAFMEATIRIFPSGIKGCYNIPITEPTRYYVRLTHWYYDYDSLGAPPIFNISLGNTFVYQNVMDDVSINTLEFIYNANTSVYICLLKVKEVPVISGLELRNLTSASYNNSAYSDQILSMWFRLNCGSDISDSSGDVKYPSDPLDRIWSPDASQYGNIDIEPADKLVALHIAKNLTGTFGPPDEIPAFIINTARSVAEPGQSLNYTFNDLSSPATYIIYLYFAEIEEGIVAGSRIFDVRLNGQTVASGVDIYARVGKNRLLSLSFTVRLEELMFIVLELKPVGKSKPVISGIDLEQLVPLANTTSSSDAQALQDAYIAWSKPAQLQDWMGDPCEPYPWSGVSCNFSTTPYSVDGLNLSSYNLSGGVPPALVNLTQLKSLSLDNNYLTGPIPGAIGSLPQLKTLELQNNALSGSVPPELFTSKSLTRIDLSNNRLNGSVTNRSNPGVTILLDGNAGLCSTVAGYNLQNCSATPSGSPPTVAPTSSKSSNTAVIAGVVCGGLAVFAILCGAIIVWLLRTKKNRNMSSVIGSSSPGTSTLFGSNLLDAVVPHGSTEWEKPKEGIVIPNGPGGMIAAVKGGHMARQFCLEEMNVAAGGFMPINQIGVGGFGGVWKGTLPDGTVVAIKKRSGNSMQGQREFYNEVVNFKIYWQTKATDTPVSLADNASNPLGQLEWSQRLNIALGAAKGVSCGQTHVSTMVKGTAGYLDPEYYTIQQLTDKSDVYSFGVVLLELITGREPINLYRPRPEWSLVEWARPNLQRGNLKGIVDPTLGEDYSLEAMWKVAEVGIMCVEPVGDNRPSMSDVVKELKEAASIELGGNRSRGTSNVTFSDSAASDPEVIVVEAR
eukprot:SM000005S17227  [mRNA]  locus=s5:932110:938046:+ [translate_table: standard]